MHTYITFRRCLSEMKKNLNDVTFKLIERLLRFIVCRFRSFKVEELISVYNILICQLHFQEQFCASFM